MTPSFTLDARLKGYPLSAPPVALADIAQRRWQVLANDLPFPIPVLQRSALAHNLHWMQQFAQRKGIALAPHGKTTMSPQLFAQQLAAGAWGLTLANAFQARVGVEAGAHRLIIANQVVCDADLDGFHALLCAHPGLQLWFLVDSLAQLALIEDWARRRGTGRVFDVLLEVGMPGQRTGCRTQEQALALAQAMAASPAVRLGGIECYEGGLARCDSAHDSAAVTGLVQRVMALARACDAQGLFADPTILLTAGGSAIFDLVVPLLQLQGLSRPVQGVLRSGCYVTHDHGNYARFLALVAQREGLDETLRPALQVWAMVQSVPEPGLALLGCGRRDISFDIDLPMPVQRAPLGATQAGPVPSGWQISALNDHHAYLRFPVDGPHPAVGDRVALGISHPCTTFDKWHWMPVVDDQGQVVDAVTLHF